MNGTHDRVATNTTKRGYAAMYVSLLSILFCFVVCALYIHSFGTNVFFADEWSFVPLLREAHKGLLVPGDLFVYHNEHIYMFPWTLMLLLGPATNYNTVPLMYAVLLCFALTSIILLLAFSGNAKGKPFWYILLFVPVPFLIFNLRQYENLLWGNQVSFGLAQSFSVVALYILYVLSGVGLISRVAIFLIAALAATVASFSAAQGLVVWPAGLLLLIISPLGRLTKSALAAVWALLGLAEWILYFAGYDRPENVPSTLYALDHPLEGLNYFATLLGSSLFRDSASAFGAGLVLIILSVMGIFLIHKERDIRGSAFWVGLLAFAFLSLASITAGRVGFPEEALFAQPTVSRYATFSLLAVASLYAIFTTLAWERRSTVTFTLLGIVLGMVLVCVPASYQAGLEAGEQTKASRERAVAVLSDYKSQPVSSFLIFGDDPRRVKRYARVLDRLDESIFADSREQSKDKE